MNDNTTTETTTEFEAFQQVHNALVDLDEDERERVLSSVSTLLGIGVRVPATSKLGMPATVAEEPSAVVSDNGPHEQEFSEFGELYHAADPKTNPEKALVTGYWLQVCKGAENFGAQSVTTELKNLGHKLTNVTDNMSDLTNKKPSLVIPLRKGGKTRQARKTYKVTGEGIKRVREMINAE